MRQWIRRLALPGGLISVVGLVAVTQPGGGGGCSGTALASSPVNGGTVVSGRVSTFGPPGEATGATASGNPGGDAAPGISLHVPGTHYSDAVNRALMGHWFHVVIGSHAADLQDIDLGPADYLNRAIDVTGAGARAMGIDPAGFPTDSQGTATEIQSPSSGTSATPVSLGCSSLSAAVGTIHPNGYVNPMPHATFSRTDMGVDGSMPVGSPIIAAGTVKIIGIDPSWYAGQPYICWQLLSGSDAGKYQFVAEQINSLAQPGQVLQQGQVIARFAPSGTGFEFGWSSSTPGRTLAAATTGYSEGQITPAGSSIRAWLNALGAGAGPDHH